MTQNKINLIFAFALTFMLVFNLLLWQAQNKFNQSVIDLDTQIIDLIR